MYFDEASFNEAVNNTLSEMRLILQNEKERKTANLVGHAYDDKYLLAELLVNSAVAGTANLLSFFGVDDAHLAKLQGWAKSKIHVLEALLRLRQAACHPALVDPFASRVASAKFDALLPRLEELRAEGQKALVFSQFTSLLELLRAELDARRIAHEDLDGATVDRESPVRRFQTDPDCGLFLISLRAGGMGLNLTAAEYVFLLDPWWNPAVEAQAIDRTHRIGQTKPVFAYRLIAKDTVEERIVELQATKRELADALFGGEGAPLADLRREDLELLLS